MKFEIGQTVLCRHPKHRCSFVGVIKEINEDQAFVKLHLSIDSRDEWWFEMRCLRAYVK